MNIGPAMARLRIRLKAWMQSVNLEAQKVFLFWLFHYSRSPYAKIARA